MGEYRGPVDAKGMEEYLRDDSKPSVTFISSLSTLKSTLERETKTVVLGFFREEDIIEDEDIESFSISSWGQYLATADTMRG